MIKKNPNELQQYLAAELTRLAVPPIRRVLPRHSPSRLIPMAAYQASVTAHFRRSQRERCLGDRGQASARRVRGEASPVYPARAVLDR